MGLKVVKKAAPGLCHTKVKSKFLMFLWKSYGLIFSISDPYGSVRLFRYHEFNKRYQKSIIIWIWDIKILVDLFLDFFLSTSIWELHHNIKAIHSTFDRILLIEWIMNLKANLLIHTYIHTDARSTNYSSNFIGALGDTENVMWYHWHISCC